MRNLIKNKEFKLLDEGDNYKMFVHYNYYKVHLTSVYYKVEGDKTEVLDRIERELQAYHPCGYSTRFSLVEENLDENTVIYEGYRSNSCD